MTPETWREFRKEALFWPILVLALQGFTYYIGGEPASLPMVAFITVVPWAFNWTMLWFRPHYLDSRSEKRAREARDSGVGLSAPR